MKIMVISTMFPTKLRPTSGIFLANLMKELSQKVDQLIIITPRPYIPKFLTQIKKKWMKWRIDPMIYRENRMEIIRPFVLYFRSDKLRGISSILSYYSLIYSLRKYLINERIELIIGHRIIPEGIIATYLGKNFNVPVISWAIGSDIHYIAKRSMLNFYYTKKCLKNSTRILTTSRELEKCVKKISNGFIEINTFYRGINLTNFQDLNNKDIFKKKLKLKIHSKYILFIGRLTRNKGIYELAEAFINISKKHSDYNLLLIGEEIEKENLVKLFKNAGILDKVSFKGIIPHKEIAYYMNVSDLLLFPSWNEGLPNVVMEAMACGLPVVTSNVGGIPEIVINNITGLSVPAKNVGKLTEAAIRMIEDEKLRETCTKNAKKLIIEKFDVKKNVNLLYNIMEETINANRI